MTWRPMDIVLYRGCGALLLALHDGEWACIQMAHCDPQTVHVSELEPPPPGPPARLEEARAERESFVRRRGLR